MSIKLAGAALAAGMAITAASWSGAALADDVLTIGFTMSETGALSLDSTGQSQGFQLWRDQINAAGGLAVGGKHYQIKFVTYDDQSKSDRVQQLYSRLILEDKADFLFSPYSSGLTATAAVISEQYDRVMLTTGAAEEKTYALGNTKLFQIYSPAAQYLASPLDALKSVAPAATVAVAYKDDAFSKAVALPAKAYAAKIGLKVAFDEAYAPATTDFGPILNKIITAKPDALIGGGHYVDGSTITRQLFDQKVPLKFITLLVAPDNPEFATLGEAAIGLCVPSQWLPQVTYKPAYGPTPEAFGKAFRERFGKDPSYHAAGGYASGLILQMAIEKAGTLDPAKVAAALDQTDTTTFFGRTKFSTDPKSHGLQLAHEMVVAQWQKGPDGKLVKEVVWPAAAATRPLLYPLR